MVQGDIQGLNSALRKSFWKQYMLRPEELEVASDHSSPLVCLVLPILLGSQGLMHEDSHSRGKSW